MPGVFAGGTITFIWAFTQLGVPLVTAFHVMRLAAVLLLTEPLYRWWLRLQPQA